MYQIKIGGGIVSRPIRRVEDFAEAIQAAAEVAGQVASADLDDSTPVIILVTQNHKFRGEVVHATVQINIDQEER